MSMETTSAKMAGRALAVGLFVYLLRDVFVQMCSDRFKIPLAAQYQARAVVPSSIRIVMHGVCEKSATNLVCISEGDCR